MKSHTFSMLLMRYLFGLGTALCLSVLAYVIVTEHWFGGTLTMAVLLVLAAVQLVVQLICFLHLSVEGRAQTRTLSFVFVFIMAIIIVIGSVWIMRNLDYRMSTSSDAMNDYMKLQNTKGF